MASLSHCSRVAVLDVGMRVDLSGVSGDRGSDFLSLPSLVAQGVSLIVVLMLGILGAVNFFRKTATFMKCFID